jgi:hypothetical protein
MPERRERGRRFSGLAAPPPAGKPQEPYWNIRPYPALLNHVVVARAAVTRALYAATSDDRSSSSDLTSTSPLRVVRLSTILLGSFWVADLAEHALAA